MGGSLPHQHHFHANFAKILSTKFHFFLLWSEIVQEPKKLEKHKISHLKSLYCGNFWFKLQTYILKRDCHTNFHSKISFDLAFFRRMQFSSRDGRRWPHLIIHLKLSLYFVLKSIFTFHGHACKWVKLTFYLKMNLFAKKNIMTVSFKTT